METKEKLIAIVKSPSKDAHLRTGKGFSLNEIRQAGKTVKFLEDLNIRIDYFRNSVYSENIEKLKSIEVPKKKDKKHESDKIQNLIEEINKELNDLYGLQDILYSVKRIIEYSENKLKR